MLLQADAKAIYRAESTVQSSTCSNGSLSILFLWGDGKSRNLSRFASFCVLELTLQVVGKHTDYAGGRSCVCAVKWEPQWIPSLELSKVGQSSDTMWYSVLQNQKESRNKYIYIYLYRILRPWDTQHLQSHYRSSMCLQAVLKVPFINADPIIYPLSVQFQIRLVCTRTARVLETKSAYGILRLEFHFCCQWQSGLLRPVGGSGWRRASGGHRLSKPPSS